MSFDGSQFDRAFVIDLGNVRISSLEAETPLSASFSIERDTGITPNNLEMTIYNLPISEQRALSSQTRNVVSIAAGYQKNPQLLFLGDVRRVESWKEKTDFITRVSAGDGEDKLEQSVINRNFAKGTPTGVILKALIDALGIGQGNVEDFVGASFSNGVSALETPLLVQGAVSNELRWFADSLGIEWSIQLGAFHGRRIGEAAKQEGPLITPDTGLLEKVRVGKGKGKLKAFETVVSFEALLLPNLVPGVAFRIDCPVISGDFVAKRTTHWGDTFGDSWFVSCDGVPL